MSDENFREVFRALREAQSKYVYFLLAAVGAAIALALSQTHDSRLSWWQLPLAAAVVSWGLSFIFGCSHLQYVSSTLYANSELLRVQAGSHPRAGTHPEIIAAASDGIREAIENNSEKANRRAHLQFWMLIAGAVLYIGWHVIEMWLRTTAAPAAS